MSKNARIIILASIVFVCLFGAGQAKGDLTVNINAILGRETQKKV